MAAVRSLHLMPYRSLQLLLLGLAHEWRLPRKCLLKMSEKVGHIRPVPDATPVS
jgi:hypothetical protein